LIRENLLEVIMPSSESAEAASYDSQPLISGLVELQMATQAQFKLTEEGRIVANKLREWKSEPGNNFHNFCSSD
jgi:hypothetical protein